MKASWGPPERRSIIYLTRPQETVEHMRMAEKQKFINFPMLLLAGAIAVSFVGMSYPYGFPLFSVGVLINSLLAFYYFLYGRGINVTDRLDKVFLVLYSLIVCAYIFAWFVFEGRIDRLVASDFKNMVSLSVFLVIFLILLRSRQDAEKLYSYLTRICIATMFLVGLVGLHKIYMLNQGVFLEQYFYDGKYATGTALVKDYNIYSLTHLFALIFVVENFQKTRSFFLKLFYSVSLLVFIPNIFLSGSRRGIIFLGLLMSLYFLVTTYNLSKSYFRLLASKLKKTSIQNFIILIMGLFVLLMAAPKLEINDAGQFNALIFRFNSLLELLENSGGEKTAFSERTERWNAAVNIINDYSASELMFGNGFDYHRRVNRALSDNGDVDYPHNLMISLFLSNGFFGFLITGMLLAYVAFMAFKIRQDYPNLLILYGITLIFVLSSGDQWFSIKSFLVLIFLIFSLFRFRNSYE